MCLQRPLPKLPIPDLSDTLDKYLRCIQPIVTSAQYEATRHLVAEFGGPGGEGEYLQEKLQQYADTVENWVRVAVTDVRVAMTDVRVALIDVRVGVIDVRVDVIDVRVAVIDVRVAVIDVRVAVIDVSRNSYSD